MVDLCRLRAMNNRQIGSREAEICLKKLDNKATLEECLELELLGRVKRERRSYIV